RRKRPRQPAADHRDLPLGQRRPEYRHRLAECLLAHLLRPPRLPDGPERRSDRRRELRRPLLPSPPLRGRGGGGGGVEEAAHFFAGSPTMRHIGKAFFAAATPAALTLVPVRSSSRSVVSSCRCFSVSSPMRLPASDSRSSRFSDFSSARWIP